MPPDLVRVAMVILHRDGRVLMQLRGSDPRVYFGGMWGIFGGHMEPGETPEETAIREIEEELGLVLTAPLELVAHRIDDDRERFIYAMPLEAGLDSLTLREGDGMALIAYEALASYTVIPVHREVLQDFFAEGRG